MAAVKWRRNPHGHTCTIVRRAHLLATKLECNLSRLSPGSFHIVSACVFWLFHTQSPIHLAFSRPLPLLKGSKILPWSIPNYFHQDLQLLSLLFPSFDTIPSSSIALILEGGPNRWDSFLTSSISMSPFRPPIPLPSAHTPPPICFSYSCSIRASHFAVL